jgi:RNA 2',3'-cyclic 3'-phosphodiesterase
LTNNLVRIFIAVEVPEGEVKNRIIGSMRAVSESGADLKPVEPQNIHITLRFLGEVTTAKLESIKLELNKITFNSFDVSLQGVGVFPDYKHINVIWVAVDEGNIGLVDLYERINNVLRGVGIPSDIRGLSPHITVARVRSGRNKENLSKTISGLKDIEFGTFHVHSFHLKKSTLTSTGPIYQSLLEVQAVKGPTY